MIFKAGEISAGTFACQLRTEFKASLDKEKRRYLRPIWLGMKLSDRVTHVQSPAP
jgi:hypothetical protein